MLRIYGSVSKQWGDFLFGLSRIRNGWTSLGLFKILLKLYIILWGKSDNIVCSLTETNSVTM